MQKITQKQKEFIPKLTEWLDSKGDGFFLIVRGRRRDTLYFNFLLYSVGRKGEYSDEDAHILNLLSRNYYGEEKGLALRYWWKGVGY